MTTVVNKIKAKNRIPAPDFTSNGYCRCAQNYTSYGGITIRLGLLLCSVPVKSSKKNLILLKAESLVKFPWLVHGFSTRLNGFSRVYGGNSLNLGFTKEDSRSSVERNRTAFLKTLG